MKSEKNMNKLVIYYSFEGNTKLMAENIAKTIDAFLLLGGPQSVAK